MIVSDTLRHAFAPIDSPVGRKMFARITKCIEEGLDESSSTWDFIREERALLSRVDTEQRDLAQKEMGAKPVVKTKPFRFSPARERVLALLALGHTNKEMGTQLGLSDKTITRSICAMFQQIGVDNRVKLARWAWERDSKNG